MSTNGALALADKLFKLHSDFKPAGDQAQAIEKLTGNLGNKSLLLGVTGSGKTFSLANVIANQDRQVLIISPNKTLAAQLYEEFSHFFPENKVCYFVSYYDYYMPESYSPSSDTYVAKETKINKEIDRLRMDATVSIVNREDTIVIASVSAIYSLGNPMDYRSMTLAIAVGDKYKRTEFCKQLIALQYFRGAPKNEPCTFSVSGNIITIDLPYIRDFLKVDLEGDRINRISLVDKQNFTIAGEMDSFLIFPAKHFVVDSSRKKGALEAIAKDLENELAVIENPLVKERLKIRVRQDMALIDSVGYCTGIENYSVYFDGRGKEDRPFCLMDFFVKDFLLIIDESHITVPQLGAMYEGDRSRKKNLVDFGFRMQAAYCNRPLKFNEIEPFLKNTIFVSATPGPYELAKATKVVEQIVRPTGIVDPEIHIFPREGQMKHLITEIKATEKEGFRTLVTVLTKKSAEQMALFLEEAGIKVCYLHSEVKTQQRTELLNKLRDGTFTALVGINLLREGLDLPEVALVAVMDADIESFLRDPRSLIQTIGRAARNTNSKVFFFADKITKSMQKTIDETNRRRAIQIQHNQTHGLTPQTTTRKVGKSILSKLGEVAKESAKKQLSVAEQIKASQDKQNNPERIERKINTLKKKMNIAAKNRDFDLAILLRDEIKELEASLKKA